jgi:hypothetical protein
MDERVEEAIRDEKPPRNRGEHFYSDTAKRFFAKMKAFRARGFSFVQICKAYEKIEQLPKHSNPYSLRQAFLRELSRRDQNRELLKAVEGSFHEAERETSQPLTSAKPAAGVQENDEAETEINNELTEEKRISALTSSTVKTGLGKLTKHSDGSFDFDWK